MTDQQRYDRQLRLWGEVAQQRLENSKLLAIGSDCVATEYLKSVILPGIGYIMIADDHQIDDLDIETNFFVEITDMNKQRGEITLQNLLELNDRVKGEFKQITLHEIIETNNQTHFIDQFNVIVCSNQRHSEVIELSQMTEYPVIEIVTNGYLGYVKAYYKSFVIFDNGEDKMMDLRIQESFPKLTEFYQSIDIPSLNKEDHSHIPFPLILMYALNEWRKENNTNSIPKKITEKNRLKEIIRKEKRSFTEENFIEAERYAFHCWGKPKGIVDELINDERRKQYKEMTIKEEKEFWLFISIVRKFYDRNGRLPIDPTLNDMICGNEYFVKLQQVYKEQMEEDVKEMMKDIEIETREIGEEILTEESVKRYCKSIRRMRVHDGNKKEIQEEYEDDLFEGEESLAMYLLIFYGMFRFEEKYGRIPCDEKDREEMKRMTEEVMKEKGIQREIKHIQIEEICRFGGVQIHSVNSVIGSFVGQEIIKFVTHQFDCLHTTFLMNTITGKSLHGIY